MLIRIKDKVINLKHVSDIGLYESKGKSIEKYSIRFNTTSNNPIFVSFEDKSERDDYFKRLCTLSINIKSI
jgi:hypothetical protein